MSYYLKIVGFVSLLLSLVGCSHFNTNRYIKVRDTEYLKAQRIPLMRVPPGYSAASIQENYPVPIKNYPEAAKKVDLTPPGLNSTGN